MTTEEMTIIGKSVNRKDAPVLMLAKDKVRYHGEPIAVVVANSEYEAKKAAELVQVEYEPLPVVNSPREAIKPNAPLIHENLGDYRRLKHVFPNRELIFPIMLKLERVILAKHGLNVMLLLRIAFPYLNQIMWLLNRETQGVRLNLTGVLLSILLKKAKGPCP